jgi:hypothetical protein
LSPNIPVVRSRNAQTLFQVYAEEQIASGGQTKGMELAFASKLGVSAVTWSHAKTGRRPIGDKLARQIETACGKPPGWLDEEREPVGLSAAEQAFLAVALKAWRATNAAGRREMREAMKRLAGG